jgi:hypothetical protein
VFVGMSIMAIIDTWDQRPDRRRQRAWLCCSDQQQPSTQEVADAEADAEIASRSRQATSDKRGGQSQACHDTQRIEGEGEGSADGRAGVEALFALDSRPPWSPTAAACTDRCRPSRRSRARRPQQPQQPRQAPAAVIPSGCVAG